MNRFSNDLADLIFIGLAGYLTLAALYHSLRSLSRGPAPAREVSPETAPVVPSICDRRGPGFPRTPADWIALGLTAGATKWK